VRGFDVTGPENFEPWEVKPHPPTVPHGRRRQ
jgi:hypothetical protein